MNSTNAQTTRHNRQIAAWLFVCCLMVYGMVILGGVTRLTGSGLSMVEWDPIFGIVPPLDAASWDETFRLYQQSPEYQKINVGMDLDGFKRIYWFEYSHRVLGRTIGMVFLLPFLFFLARGRIQRPLIPKLVTMFILGGLQGVLGWYMVKSGLVDRPDVSQYRLTAHLGLAVAIYAYMLWVAFDLLFPRGSTYRAAAAPFAGWSLGLVLLVYLMILSGGLVAGTDAGFSYPTWPLMGPSFIPEGLYATAPAWLAAFEDVTTIQFNHRVFAYALFVLANLFALLVNIAFVPALIMVLKTPFTILAPVIFILCVIGGYAPTQDMHDVTHKLKGMKKPASRPRLHSFSEDDEAALYDATDELFGDFLFAAIHTGLRPFCELARMTADEVVETDHLDVVQIAALGPIAHQNPVGVHESWNRRPGECAEPTTSSLTAAESCGARPRVRFPEALACVPSTPGHISRGSIGSPTCRNRLHPVQRGLGVRPFCCREDARDRRT